MLLTAQCFHWCEPFFNMQLNQQNVVNFYHRRDFQLILLKKSVFFVSSLSLQPFEYPVCTPDGTVFDIL